MTQVGRIDVADGKVAAPQQYGELLGIDSIRFTFPPWMAKISMEFIVSSVVHDADVHEVRVQVNATVALVSLVVESYRVPCPGKNLMSINCMNPNCGPPPSYGLSTCKQRREGAATGGSGCPDNAEPYSDSGQAA